VPIGIAIAALLAPTRLRVGRIPTLAGAAVVAVVVRLVG
jgi:hypothetical protein